LKKKRKEKYKTVGVMIVAKPVLYTYYYFLLLLFFFFNENVGEPQP